MRRSLASLALAVAAAVAAPGCSTSSTKATAWKSPAAEGRVLRNVAVFAVAKDPARRKTTENMFARSLTGETKATPSHTFVTNDDLKDKDKVVAKVKAGGFDGAVIFRVIAIDERKNEKIGPPGTSSAYYGSMGVYWGWSSAPMFVTGYTEKQEIVQIEALAYAASDEKLLWAEQTEMKNPEAPLDVIEGIVKGTIDGLRKANLIR